MQILMTGIDHSTASVDIRGQFSFIERERNEFLSQIKKDHSIDGCVLLSTCNRTELWITVSGEETPDLVDVLCGFKGIDSASCRSLFSSRSGEEAITYLFEMTSGLHSMIVGEDQILAQVKKALDESRAAECCGSVLDVLFRSAITGAKKVKTELSLSTANASAVNFAISHLKDQGMHFRGKKCLVIGNGEMGRRAASALLELGAEVTVTIRQYRSGNVNVIPGCSRINYSERYSLMPGCSIIVSATSSPNTTITAEVLRDVPVSADTVFIDLAVPRDIDPGIRELGYTLLDIDRFSVPQTRELNMQLEQAKLLLDEQQTKFLNWYACRDLLPAVDRLGDSFSDEVLYRMGASLKQLGPEQRVLIAAAVRDAASKELKKVLFRIRDDAGMDVFHKSITATEGKHTNG